MEIRNLTPHALKITGSNEYIHVIPPSGTVARVAVERTKIGRVEGTTIDVFSNTYGEVENLPDPEEGVVFVVSGMVLDRIQDRIDVFAPGDLIRDDGGRPIGCRGLRR